MGSLAGKVAIVTGAGRGIGRAEASLLAGEGASVIVNDLGGEWDGTGQDTRAAQTVVDEITAAGGSATANYDDVASWDGARALVAQAVEAYGRLDILVNNAGILRDRVLINMTEEDWDAVVRVHLKGHAATIHHAATHWRARNKAGEAIAGRIINTASESGFIGMAGQGNYAAAKAGIAALTMVAARELRRYGVTANCIAPRARTRLITQTFGDTIMAPPKEQEAFDQFAPENVAPLVAFLASDGASHISGQSFVVYGGAIQLMQPWSGARSIDRSSRWTVAELGDEIDQLFEGASALT